MTIQNTAGNKNIQSNTLFSAGRRNAQWKILDPFKRPDKLCSERQVSSRPRLPALFRSCPPTPPGTHGCAAKKPNGTASVGKCFSCQSLGLLVGGGVSWPKFYCTGHLGTRLLNTSSADIVPTPADPHTGSIVGKYRFTNRAMCYYRNQHSKGIV